HLLKTTFYSFKQIIFTCFAFDYKWRDKMSIDQFLKDRTKQLESETIDLRAYLHTYPELSGKEYETSKFVKEKVTEIGLDVEEITNRKVFTVLLDKIKEGKTLGIRTDIDALTIEESDHNLDGKRKYLSNHPGVMHACGHDGNMAIILTVIKMIKEIELTGKIYFIFEDAEENGEGIEPMIEHLKNKDIDAIY